MEDKNVLLMDAEQRCAEGILSSLATKGFTIIGLSPEKWYPAKFSRGLSASYLSPRLAESYEEYYEFLTGLKEKGVIVPSGDLSSKFLSKYKKLLHEQGFRFYVPDFANFNALFDKWECNKSCVKAGIPVAKTSLVNSREDIIEKAYEIGFPLLLKPTALAGGNYVKAENIKDLMSSVDRIFDVVNSNSNKLLDSGVILQEWLDSKMADNWSCDAYFDGSGTLIDYVTIRRVRTSLNAAGNPTSRMYCGEFSDNKDLKERTERLLKAHSWIGFAHVEYIYSDKNNDFLLTEVNPRLPGYSFLLSSSGHQQAYYYCSDLFGEKCLPVKNHESVFYTEALRYPGDITDGVVNCYRGHVSIAQIFITYVKAIKSKKKVVVDLFDQNDFRLTFFVQVFNGLRFIEKVRSYLARRFRRVKGIR